ncbi:MAG: tetratricopeptide repeat protein [Verrucomicrobiota bacterium]
MNPRCFCLAVCLILLESAHAQEYEGATKVLERLRAGEGESLDPAGSLKKQIALFKVESRNLAPEVAARKWLELFDAFVKIPRESLYAQDYNARLDLDSLIEALPATPAWEALATEIGARQPAKDGKNAALKLLLWTLRGKPGEVPEVLANVRAALADNDAWLQQGESGRASELDKLSGELSRRVGKAVDEIAAFRKELEMQEKEKGERSVYLSVPPLAGVTPDAEALLTQALKCDAELSFSDEPTSKLAAKLVMANPGILGKPQWRLVRSPADAPLYEKIWKRFPKDEERSDRHQAAGYYIISLIAADKTQEARKLLFREIASQHRNSSAGEIPSIDSADSAAVRKTRSFLADLLTAVPELPYWENYFSLAAQENATPEAIAFLRATLARMPGNAFLQLATEEHLLDSHLAADEIEPAVEMMRARIKAGPGEVAAMGDVEKTAIQKRLAALGVDVTPELLRNLTKPPGTAEELVEGYVRFALKLTDLGRLLKKPEWVNEGLAAALAQVNSVRPNSWSSSDIDELVTALVENGRGAEAEKVVAGRLLKLRSGSDRSSYEVRSALASLVYIYRQAGKGEEIVRLLDGCDFWGTDDLGKLADVRFDSFPLQLMAAEALAKVGKKDIALQLVQRVLQRDSGNDAVYQLLLTLGSPDVEMLLDKVYATNRFEERPLVWKAKVQLDAGRVDEAEKTIRAAIAIDPSDGEQGKGDRMRAYSVLAEVLEKKGDAEQAKIMRGAVEAIRISEDADDWWGAGLTTRAVKMYQEALDHFADAYCIQSRLALRYSEIGDAVNAEKHYQRAFELMPSSFGRVESHCFGCEGIFRRDESQGVADRVFTRLAKEMPDRAQVFYLLGYLRESQGRAAEAIVQFRRAVALDPEYINAWKKIADLAGADLSPKERDEASLALFRLDPGSDSLDKVTDLPGLWNLVLELELALPKPLSGPVYRLAASKADPRESQSDSSGSRNPEAMREQMTSNDIIQAVSAMMTILINQE